MKILQLDIKGFRSLKDVTWRPGDLNILIGANGTGKSNLLRFLELMAVVAKGGLGKYVQSLGGIAAIVWDGEAPDITVKLDCVDRSHLFEEDEPQQFRYQFQMDHYASFYGIDNEMLTLVGDEEVLIERDYNGGRFRGEAAEEFREIDVKRFLMRSHSCRRFRLTCMNFPTSRHSKMDSPRLPFTMI